MNIITQVMILQCDVFNKNTYEILEKQDVLVMEDMDKNKIVLNLTTGVDMTHTLWTPIINHKGKVAKVKQELFRNSSIIF